MPTRAKRICPGAGCNVLTDGGRCPRCAGKAKQVERDPAIKQLYNSKRWQERRQRQLAENPWCANCLARGIYVPATEVHHIERHKGDRESFFNGPLESLCKPCHSRETALEVFQTI